MKKLLLVLILALLPSLSWAQCNGVFPPNSICGNPTSGRIPPKPFVTGGIIVGTGIIYGSAYLGAKTCDGVTDVYTELQAFLDALSANGVSGASTVGIFPPGVCYLNSASSLTFTVNSSNNTVNYVLSGFGTTLKTDISRTVYGLAIRRGTFTTYEDERTNIIVEGLVIDHHNNANAVAGFDIDRNRVKLRQVTVNAGDDNGVANRGNYIGAYFHNPVAHNTDASYGTINSEVSWSTFKGRATRMPIGITLNGTANASDIHDNELLGVSSGIQTEPMCAANNANCASIANGVTITNNKCEDFLYCIRFFNGSSVTFSQAVGWQIYSNRAEASTPVTGIFLNLGGLGQQTDSPMVLGPNMLQSTVANYFTQGATPIQLNILDTFTGQVTIDPGSLAAGAVAYLTPTLSILGTNTTMKCQVNINGDTQGVIPQCYVSATSTITIYNTNPTSGARDLGSKLYNVTVRYTF